MAYDIGGRASDRADVTTYTPQAAQPVRPLLGSNVGERRGMSRGGGGNAAAQAAALAAMQRQMEIERAKRAYQDRIAQAQAGGGGQAGFGGPTPTGPGRDFGAAATYGGPVSGPSSATNPELAAVARGRATVARNAYANPEIGAASRFKQQNPTQIPREWNQLGINPNMPGDLPANPTPEDLIAWEQANQLSQLGTQNQAISGGTFGSPEELKAAQDAAAALGIQLTSAFGQPTTTDQYGNTVPLAGTNPQDTLANATAQQIAALQAGRVDNASPDVIKQIYQPNPYKQARPSWLTQDVYDAWQRGREMERLLREARGAAQSHQDTQDYYQPTPPDAPVPQGQYPFYPYPSYYYGGGGGNYQADSRWWLNAARWRI